MMKIDDDSDNDSDDDQPRPDCLISSSLLVELYDDEIAPRVTQSVVKREEASTGVED
ncbi:MAG: hypothetical protein QGI24_09645 [Kiritimatiellia bacterium]|jgi:hypothetical protein|nr:hypothetical protein [Kiritimatiellia bacterium]MDP6849037.1 hypothetical protein [Kiritimatiellia bacterium]